MQEAYSYEKQVNAHADALVDAICNTDLMQVCDRYAREETGIHAIDIEEMPEHLQKAYWNAHTIIINRVLAQTLLNFMKLDANDDRYINKK